MRLTPSVSWLLLFVPVALSLEHVGTVAPTIVFFSAALAIVPAASLIVRSTEQISTRTGDAVGGLLNATFGNAPEMIIALVALRAGLPDMVRASIIGAILANLLLALGASFLIGGLRYREQEYNPGAARIYSSMMLLAVISLMVPGAFERAFSSPEHVPSVRALNAWLAALLLVAYGLYLVFMLRTHPQYFRSAAGLEEGREHGAAWGLPRAIGTLVGASALAAWMSEVLVGAAEATGEALGMSETFIGIVIVAIVGGAAESLSAVAAARKNKVDLTMGITFGSCIQIALFVAPALVLLSRLVAPTPLYLSFSRAELGVLFLSVLVGAMISGDGRANWYKGIQLIVIYTIVAMMFYFVPDTTP